METERVFDIMCDKYKVTPNAKMIKLTLNNTVHLFMQSTCNSWVQSECKSARNACADGVLIHSDCTQLQLTHTPSRQNDKILNVKADGVYDYPRPLKS